jgi:hypothetical protein
MDALTTRITIATDDTHYGAVGTGADVDGVVHGQLRTIGEAVEIMDDWDESDRCAVNPISGQIGIAANTGAMDALTTRITLATDDAQYGSVGAAADVDGVIHGQLRYIGENLGSLRTFIQDCEDNSDWAAVSDAQNLADDTEHITGTVSVEWDKTGGSNVISGIDDTITSLDLSAYAPSDYLMACFYISSLTDVAKVHIYVGTDNANYTEWEWADSDLSTGWNLLTTKLADYTAVAGTGMQQNAVTYVQAAVEFDAAGDTLNDMKVDHIAMVTGESLQPALDTGIVNEMTTRTTLATDDPHFGELGAASDIDGNIHGQLRYANDYLVTIDADTNAIKDAVEIMDDWDESDRCAVNPISGQIGIAANAGAMDALTTRVTLATDDTHYGAVGTAADVDGVVHGQLRYIGDAALAIQTAVEIMDDWDETNRAAVNPISGQIGIAANAGAMDALTTRVTLATDDTHYGAVGAASDHDGVIHAQLRYANDYLTTIDSDTNTIQGDTTSIDGKTPALGTAAMVGSVPMTLATDDTQFGAVGAATDVDGNIHGQLRYIGEALDTVIAILPGASGSGYQSYIDANFVVGDSPQTHDVNNDLGRNGDRGYIACDGAGDISVQYSESGAVAGEDAIILKNGETFSLDGLNVDQITVTHVNDSAYRIFVR